jgi:glycosyltransferase involved in cell wall biosynthesis
LLCLEKKTKNSLGANKQSYILANLDVQQAINAKTTSAERHFKDHGYEEVKNGKRLIALGLPAYSETSYLAANLDVIEEIAAGKFTSAFQHYLNHGVQEMLAATRKISGDYHCAISDDFLTAINPSFCPALYLKANTDVACSSLDDESCAWQHFSIIGIYEVLAGTRYLYPKCKLFNQLDYVNAFPDVLDVLVQGGYHTPFEHFVLHGAKEMSEGSRQHINMVMPYFYVEPKINSEIASEIANFAYKPLISIVMPVYNVEPKWLALAYQSLVKQWYINWVLCVCDDASTNSDTTVFLHELAKNDDRVKVIFSSTNENISAASNKALALADGEFIALMDHDDELTNDALYLVAKALQNNDVDFVYSDEDKIDVNGHCYDPHFKSAWNLDLLYSQNYVSHLGIYKTSIVKAIGGFRLGYEGSQDYDLLLRYSREIDHGKITHIPKVLYHWRAIEGSTAMQASEKSYATDAGIKALQQHFASLNLRVTVSQGKHENIYKLDWLIKQEPLVSLIIPTYNGYDITKQAIDSILEKTTYKNYEILLVDNNSDDPVALAYFADIAKHPQVNLLRYPHPFNYAAINNFAVANAKGLVIGLINNDVEVINPEWLTEMVSHAVRPGIGSVGAMLYYPDDTIQHAGVILGIGGVAGHSHKYFARSAHGYFSRLNIVQNLSAVTAACLLVEKAIFEQVDGLNDKDLTVAFNDVDLCLKVSKAGYRNLWTPYAELYHHESVSRGHEDNPEKVARFNKESDYMKATWGHLLLDDPFYSSNLSLTREDFSLR